MKMGAHSPCAKKKKRKKIIENGVQCGHMCNRPRTVLGTGYYKAVPSSPFAAKMWSQNWAGCSPCGLPKACMGGSECSSLHGGSLQQLRLNDRPY